jgi:hypothetical protein
MEGKEMKGKRKYTELFWRGGEEKKWQRISK